MKLLGFLKNRKHENVGRRFYSPYFERFIVVSAYNGDSKWWFRFNGRGKEHRAESTLSHFIDNKLERPELDVD